MSYIISLHFEIESPTPSGELERIAADDLAQYLVERGIITDLLTGDEKLVSFWARVQAKPPRDSRKEE